MPIPAAGRTAVLVVRVWVEGEPPALRARLTQTLDISRSCELSLTAASVDDVCAIARAWIEAFQDQALPGG
jgi:hypothetical protein